MPPRKRPIEAAIEKATRPPDDAGIYEADYTVEEHDPGTAIARRPLQPGQLLAPGSMAARYARLGDEAKSYARQSKADRTIAAYASDFKQFESWSKMHQRQALPCQPEDVADYVAGLAKAGYKVTTIERRLSAISQRHKMNGYDSPCVSEIVHIVLEGIRRDETTNHHQAKKAAAITKIVLEFITGLEKHPNPSIRVRDKAILLLGLAGAFRRSEIAGLKFGDLKFERGQGYMVQLKRSKTNQTGELEEIPIDYGNNALTCPVRSLQQWIALADLQPKRDESQPLFRRILKTGEIGPEALADKSIARIVKRAAQLAGHDPADFAGHSLRAGFATQAALSGEIAEREAMGQMRQRSTRVHRGYIRTANRWKNAPVKKLGL